MPRPSRCQLLQTYRSPATFFTRKLLSGPSAKSQESESEWPSLEVITWHTGPPPSGHCEGVGAWCPAVCTGCPLGGLSLGEVHELPLPTSVTGQCPPGSVIRAICTQAGLNYGLFLNKGKLIPAIQPPGAKAQLPVCAPGWVTL